MCTGFVTVEVRQCDPFSVIKPLCFFYHFLQTAYWHSLECPGGGGARTAAEAAEGVHTACVRDREAEPMRGTAPTLPAATRQIQNVLVLSCLVLSYLVLSCLVLSCLVRITTHTTSIDSLRAFDS